GTENALYPYDPRNMLARAVRIHSAGDDTGATFTVSGFDIYGQPMTEAITGASGADANGKKAFKYIAQIMPTGTLSGSAQTAGTTDVVGFPLFVPAFPFAQIYYGASGTLNPLITSTSNFVVGAAPASGDVRGTWTLSASSNGTNRLTIIRTIPAYNLGPTSGF